jgi:hypothetical protein
MLETLFLKFEFQQGNKKTCFCIIIGNVTSYLTIFLSIESCAWIWGAYEFKRGYEVLESQRLTWVLRNFERDVSNCKSCMALL